MLANIKQHFLSLHTLHTHLFMCTYSLQTHTHTLTQSVTYLYTLFHLTAKKSFSTRPEKHFDPSLIFVKKGPESTCRDYNRAVLSGLAYYGKSVNHGQISFIALSANDQRLFSNLTRHYFPSVTFSISKGRYIGAVCHGQAR